MKISSPLSVSSCTPWTTFRVSALVLALSAISLATTNSQAAVSYSAQGTPTYSTLGDLSIYQPPVGETQPTVMLMLDKSGSMGNFKQEYRNNGNNFSTRIDSLWDDYGSVDYIKSDYIIREDIEVEKSEIVCVRTIFGICIKTETRYYTVTETIEKKYSYHTPNLTGKDGKPCYYSNDSKQTVQNSLDTQIYRSGTYFQDYPSNFNDNAVRLTRNDNGYTYPITYCIATNASDVRTTEEIAAGDIETNYRLDRLSALKVAIFKL